ncbi:MAG: SufB/SufD family protein [Candidatus Scatovivens sp.]
MNKTEKEDLSLLHNIVGEDLTHKGAYNIRKNGQGVERRNTENVEIKTKKDKDGIDIFVKENSKMEFIDIPVIITKSGIKDIVYNDFFIGKNSNVVIVAGCGIHNDENHDSEHNGIHRFFLEEGAKVKYIEKHYGEGKGNGKRILNPVTEVYLKNGSCLEMETTQIKGVDSTVRKTIGKLESNTNLVINEKIMTHGVQLAKTEFEVYLNGENSSTKVTSRSVATESSIQQFYSKVYGNSKCFGHVECDAIIMDNSSVKSVPEIVANNIEANLIHEAAIGKIAGEQVVKLMTLGLTEKQSEEVIINGFLS